ncbi:MAG: glycoside hydrolase family 127 protein [Clostridia bacterium]|nr:glycoside hydrolase family 127 protein [Clostridia bacterium]
MQNITTLQSGSIKINGKADYYVTLVENLHLKDRAIWDKFVQVFVDLADDNDRGWRCEYWGKSMRAACTCYYYSRDIELYNVLTYAVEKLLKTQDEFGRISSYSVEKEFNGWDMWGRKYVISGLLHYYDICDSDAIKKRIMIALKMHVDYIISKVGKGDGKKDITLTSTTWGGVNSCSILETIINFYNRNKEQKYLDFAEYIISTGGCAWGNLIDAVNDKSLRPSQYPVKKAYEMMSFFEGLLEYYKICGDKKYLDSALNFIDALQKHEITVIGCAGCKSEEFNDASRVQTDPAVEPMQETCVTVTWMRLLAKAFFIRGDVKYADSFEISALNGLYGSINVNNLPSVKIHTDEECGTFAFDSYSPLLDSTRNRGIGGFRNLPGGGYYGCCACIGGVAVALVPLTAVLKDDKNVYVNAYYDGKFCVDEDLSFTIKSNYPIDDNVLITITNSCDKKIKIKLRVPAWCDDFSVQTDGAVKGVKAGYKEVIKAWKVGDEIKIDIKKSVKPFELNGYTSYSYGPILLARDDKKEKVIGELSNVGLDLNKATFNRVKEADNELIRFEVVDKNKKIILTDYASCGKVWNQNNKLSVWFKSE